MVKISIGRNTFELKDVLLMEDLATFNIFDLYKLNEEMKDEKKKMELICDIGALKKRFDPLLKACLVDNNVILGKLTFEEYFQLVSHEGIMNAFSKSMGDMPELDIIDPTKTTKKE